MTDRTCDQQSSLRDREMTPRPPDIMSDDRVFLAWHRTHMANERTFLSWSRTGIALLAFGFVIEKFDVFVRVLISARVANVSLAPSPQVVYLSVASFVLAGIVILASGIRFLRIRRHINLGEASFTITPEILVILSVTVIVILSVILSIPRVVDFGSEYLY